MKHISLEEIEAYDKNYRVNFINSIVGFKMPFLLSTRGKNEIDNLAIFSSVTHLGSSPPLIGFITRPNSVPRHTFSNLLENPYFTANSVHKEIIEQAHQTSAKYAKYISEYEEVGLTKQLHQFNVPYVKESRLKFGCELVEQHEIKTNNTILLVSKLKEIIIDENLITTTGVIDFSLQNFVSVTGLGAYYTKQHLMKVIPKANP